MIRTRPILAALVALTAVAVSLALASPASASSTTGELGNIGDNLCLQPLNGSNQPGAAIVQEPCDNSFAQEWAFISLGGTSYRFQNLSSALCLDARGGATNGTPIQQWTCSSISNEKWDTGLRLPDAVPLTSQVSGTHSHCLDVPGAQPVVGLAMQLYGCNESVAQGWVAA
jgi:hypothetical protein